MNIELLRKIQDQIRKEPRQFVMKNWFVSSNYYPNCGTAACIAGWAICLTNNVNPKEAEQKGGLSCLDFWPPDRALELTCLQARDLFYEDNWPLEFKNHEEPLHERAIKRIEHLIQTGI